MDGWFEVRVAGFSREYGTLVNFKDGFHRKISTWTFFAAVSFHPRDVTFSTSVHSFSLNWSFNVIRIPVQLAVKLNTLLWNYPKKEETFHRVNTKSRQIQNFIAPCFFHPSLFSFSWKILDDDTDRETFENRSMTIFVFCYEMKNTSIFVISLHRLSFACNCQQDFFLCSSLNLYPIGNHEKDLQTKLEDR